MVGDEALGAEVVLVEAEVGRCDGECTDPLAGREALELWDHDLDHEASPDLQLRSHRPEALDLLVLGGEVHDGVPEEVGQPERRTDRRGGEVSDRDIDLLAAGALQKPGDHGR